MLTYKAATLLRNGSKKNGLSSFLPFGSSEEYLDLFRTTIFRRLTSGQLLALRLLPLSRSTTKIECNLYGIESTARSSRIDSLKMEVKLAIEQLELQQYALEHDGLDIDCKPRHETIISS